MGDLPAGADGNFGPATRTAIKQFQSFLGDPDTGVMIDAERQTLHDMAPRLSALLARDDTSPDGVSSSAVKSLTARYARGWAADKGSNGTRNPSEAVYWYGLAAQDGQPDALANLGLLLVRGQGVPNPDPAGAALLWWAAAARGEATAMFNLGALWENGIGVTADLARAKVWYERAASKGYDPARSALKRLAT
jgi:TPR repeat protein